MFRETLFLRPRCIQQTIGWRRFVSQIFCCVPSALQLLSVSAFQNWSRGNSCVVERGASGMNPLSRLRRQLSRGESPWQRGEVLSSPVNGRKKSAVKLQTFRPCQSLSLSGEVARRSRDGEGLLPLPNFFQIFLLSVQETSPLLRVRIQRGTQSTRKASLASLCPQPYRKEAVQA